MSDRICRVGRSLSKASAGPLAPPGANAVDWFLFGLLILLIAHLVIHWIWRGCSKLLRAVTGMRCRRCNAVQEWDGVCLPCARRNQLSNETWQDDLEAAKRLAQWSATHRILPPDQQRFLIESLDRIEKGEAPTGAAAASTTTASSGAVISAAPEKTINDPLSAAQPTSLPPSLRGHSQKVRPRRKTRAASKASPLQPHPLDAPEPVPVAPVIRPQQWLGQMLQAFMERSNIRWVELIAAALIVVCSCGLVISLWAPLSSASRFFPSLVFMIATAAVHGAGQYTLRTWKLKETSRGILHIGLLLIPLAVMTGILLSRRHGTPSIDAPWLAALLTGTLVYGLLASTAAKALFGYFWKPPAISNLFCSLLLIPIAMSPTSRMTANWTWIGTGIGLLFAWTMAFQATRRKRREGAFYSRQLAVATQVFFPLAILLGFSWLQQRQLSPIDPWWWSAISLFLGGAGAWALACSNLSIPSFSAAARSAQGDPTSIDQTKIDPSNWRIGIGTAGATSLMASLGCLAQIGMTREPLLGALAAIACWSTTLGWLAGRRSLASIGTLMAILLTGMLAQWGLDAWPKEILEGWQILASWIAWQRVAAIGSIAIATLLAGCILFRVIPASNIQSPPRAVGLLPSTRSFWAGSLSPRSLIESAMLAAVAALILCTLLALIALIHPASQPPHGGYWAPPVVFLAGLSTIGILFLAPRLTLTGMSLGMSLGLGMTLLAAFFFPWPQRGAWDPVQPLKSLEPLALKGLATALSWVVVAAIAKCVAVLRWKDLWRPQAGRFVTTGVMGLGLLSTTMLVDWAGEDLHRLVQFGWALPVLLLGCWWIEPKVSIRELMISMAILWSLLAFHQIAGDRGIWRAHPEVVNLWLHFGMLGMILIGSAWVIQQLRKRISWPPLHQEGRWETIGIAASLLLLAIAASSLMGAIRSWTSNLDLFRDPLEIARPIRLSVESLHQSTSIAMSVVLMLSVWLIRYRRNSNPPVLRELSALLPWSLAMIPAMLPPASLGISSMLWSLAILGIALATRPTPAGRYLAYGLGLIDDGSADPNQSSSSAWPIAERLSFASIVLFSGLLWWAGFDLPTLAGWSLGAEGAPWTFRPWYSRAWTVAHGLAPLLVFFTFRWWWARHQDPDGRRYNLESASQWLAFAIAAFLLAVDGFLKLPAITQWAYALLACATGQSLVAIALTWIHPESNNRSIETGNSASPTPTADSISALATRMANTGFVLLAIVAALGAMALLEVSRGKSITIDLGSPRVLVSVLIVLAGSGWTWWTGKNNQKTFSWAPPIATLSPFLPLAWLHGVDEGWWAPTSFAGLSVVNPLPLLLAGWSLALCVGALHRSDRNRGILRIGSSAGDLERGLWWLLFIVSSIFAASQARMPTYPIAFSFLMLFSAIAVLRGVWNGEAAPGHAGAFVAASAIALAQGPILGSTLPLPVSILLAPLAAGLLHRALCIPTKIKVHFLRLAATQGRFIDQTASLHVPLAILLATGWIAIPWLPDLIWLPVQNEWLLAVSGISLCLAIWRLTEARSISPLLSIYCSVLALFASLSLWTHQQLQLPSDFIFPMWALGCVLAMAMLAGILRDAIVHAGRSIPWNRLGMPTPSPEELEKTRRWMVSWHMVAGLLLVIPCLFLVLEYHPLWTKRFIAMLPAAASIAILPIAIDARRPWEKFTGLFLGSIGAVLLSWSDLNLDRSALLTVQEPQSWWQSYLIYAHLMRGLMAMVAISWLYRWTAQMRPATSDDAKRFMQASLALLLPIGLAGLGVVYGYLTPLVDWPRWNLGGIPLGIGLAVIITWVAMAFRLLVIATHPVGYEAELAIGQRQAAFYGFEGTLLAIAIALRSHFPEWFDGWLTQWWPLLVYLAAMVNIAIGKLLLNSDRSILRDPIERTTLLLPIIPVLGIWLGDSDSNGFIDWQQPFAFAILLLLGAALYGSEAMRRNHTGLKWLASLLGMAAFWTSLTSNPTLAFAQHPQLWIIPPAIAGLVVLEANRHQLSRSAIAATRYGLLLSIYCSSTFEMMVRSFGAQFWSPILLLTLAVLGVLLGVALRIRAFLYCGSLFVAIALVGMVWHAQRAIDQIWPWWVFGICLGISLIVFLGWMEKNRAQMAAYRESLRLWEP